MDLQRQDNLNLRFVEKYLLVINFTIFAGIAPSRIRKLSKEYDQPIVFLSFKYEKFS